MAAFKGRLARRLRQSFRTLITAAGIGALTTARMFINFASVVADVLESPG